MTFEITKDHELSRRGDCIIAVNATKGPREMSTEFKTACMQESSKITIRLEAAGIFEIIQGAGSPNLNFAHSNEIVGRKSSYASDRTIMIRANKAACDLDKRLMQALKSPETKLTIRISVEI
jgi:hypothetical protein